MRHPELTATVHALRGRIGTWRREGARIGLVPTMGALHAGHLSLVRLAKSRAERVVVTIFVNPAQFAPHEDFDRYPRRLDEDLEKLAATGATDLVFVPPTGEIYPEGFATRIEVDGPAQGLETVFRPHFFSGVATVVAKLLIAAAPDVAVFGEKDYQQLLVIRRIVEDLGLDTEIAGAPIKREADGLAMSSRNAYLDPKEREIAGSLNRILSDVAASARAGTSIPEAEDAGAAALRDAGFDTVDYVAIRNGSTLARLVHPGEDARILAAAWIGKTRLIDNMPV
ncbi:MAG TPA: pantoate--beta-alanine ligase [Rhizomicrobium sp.]|jgi:pantoate--beta-alanine ligase